MPTHAPRRDWRIHPGAPFRSGPLLRMLIQYYTTRLFLAAPPPGTDVELILSMRDCRPRQNASVLDHVRACISIGWRTRPRRARSRAQLCLADLSSRILPRQASLAQARPTPSGAPRGGDSYRGHPQGETRLTPPPSREDASMPEGV